MSPFALIFSLSLAVLATVNGRNLGHGNSVNGTVAHRSQAKRSTEHQHAKRFSGHATYFADGLGACGHYNGPNDYIVALNTPQYGSGGDCGRTITISGLGKTAQATIADECPGCPYGCLDFSEGLFQHFADLSVGEFQITWDFGGSSGGDDDSQSKPTTTKAPPPKPTTTSHSTTTTHTTTSTTSIASSSSSASSSASASASNSSSAPGAKNTPASASTGNTGTSSTGGNIAQQQKLVYVFGNIATFGKTVSGSD